MPRRVFKGQASVLVGGDCRRIEHQPVRKRQRVRTCAHVGACAAHVDKAIHIVAVDRQPPLNRGRDRPLVDHRQPRFPRQRENHLARIRVNQVVPLIEISARRNRQHIVFNQPRLSGDVQNPHNRQRRPRRAVHGCAVGRNHADIQPHLVRRRNRGNAQPRERAAHADADRVARLQPRLLIVFHQQRGKIGLQSRSFGLQQPQRGRQLRPLRPNQPRVV